MSANAGLGVAPPKEGRRAEPGGGASTTAGGSFLSAPVLTGLAVGLVALPFVVAFCWLLFQPSRLSLPDDLALIDLHTRQAMAWHQQLGVFDRNGWNHPGPAYFYVLAQVDRIFGSNGRSLFLGATLLNGAAAVCCVAVVRRWTTATRTLWAAFAVGLLTFAMAASGTGSTTYSESVLGALVSPWNPLVVILPLLLFVVLAAAAMARSTLAAAGVVLAGSFVVQTDISALPLVAAVGIVAEATWIMGAWRRRREGPAASTLTTGGRVLLVVGLVLLVLMWVPPLVQQFTNHPGNMTLIYRYFTSGRAGQSWSTAFGATAAAVAVYVVGPSEVMEKALEGTQPHQVVAAFVLLVTFGLAVGAALVGRRRGSRFGPGLGLLVAVGCLAVLVGSTHLIGHVFGYLVVWAVVLPAAALVAAGAARWPEGWSDALLRTVGRGALRGAVVVLAVAASLAATVRVASMPPLGRASDPQVAQLAALVLPRLRPGETVAVNDVGAGHSRDDVLLNIERFFGLVNVLDRDGVRPRVNKLWVVEVGPGYEDEGAASRQVVLTTWTPLSPTRSGYVGRVGDLAVQVLPGDELVAPPR